MTSEGVVGWVFLGFCREPVDFGRCLVYNEGEG
jgi:hypothetical protein